LRNSHNTFLTGADASSRACTASGEQLIMGRFLALTGLVLLLPAHVLAEESARSPEALLAHDSVVYFRFDGLEPHRKAYDQTALAEVMRGDLGDFCAEIIRLLQDSVGFGVVKEKLLAGLPPETIVKLHQAARQLPRLLEYFQHHGFVLGVEVLAFLPPRIQVTVVFPHAGQPRHRTAVFAGLQLFTELTGIPVRERKHGRRTIYQANPAGHTHTEKRAAESAGNDWARLAWWQEGEHVVLTFGTERPDHLVRRFDDTRRANLTANPLFRSVADFNRYESVARGFVDLERCVRKAQSLGPLAEKVIDQLGLAGLKNLTLHIGFAGRHQQTSIVLNLTGKRKGVLKLIPSAEVSFDRLPPLPPDAFAVTAVSVDARAWAEFAGTLHRVIGLLSGGGQRKGPFAEIDKALGIDVRKDLLDALGPTAVLYNSPGEGFSLLGVGLAVKVKDAGKLKSTLQALKQAIFGDGTSLRKVRYHGVDVHMWRLSEIGFPMTPSWTVHDGWLAAGLNPQSVKGHILRSTRRFAVWQPPPLALEFLAELKRNPKAKVLAISAADSRASLKQTAVLGQILLDTLNNFQEWNLDPSLVPHFQSLTEPLSPNVMVLVDEGDAIRLETKGSLPLPTDILGMDSVALLVLLGGLAF
jgi:hypothetical protein